jgi:ectoine hydroxylase-related dioxygenase (phytanoyl-CoA dioxygenase family)
MTMTRLDHASVEKFEEEGYLVVENLLDEERDIKPLVAEYEALLDQLATQWWSEGKLAASYQDLPFAQRLTQVIRELGDSCFYHFEISLPFSKITEDSPIHLGPAAFNLLRSPRVLDAVQSLIGPEIYCHPAHHVRIKVPVEAVNQGINDLTGTVTGHQDQAGTLPEADESNIVTAWLAINDATEANGCLMVIPGSHRGELLPHGPLPHGGAGIPVEHLPAAEFVPLPMPRGGAIFMTARTIHRSLPNVSDGIRWSVDARYMPIGRPTGRPFFPGFVGRSRLRPQTELHDSQAWANLWRQARAQLSKQGKPKFNRAQLD